jgi:hypothetical protein
VLIYTSDYDDLFPMAMGRRADTDGSWMVGTVTPMPGNSLTDAPWNDPRRIDNANVMWANATQPYVKNYDLHQLNGQTPAPPTTQTLAAGVPKTASGVSMNGLLHTLSTTEIESPSIAVMLWPGSGNKSIEQRSWANPALNCATPNLDCRFNPGGAPQSTFSTSISAYGSVTYRYTASNSRWIWSNRSYPFVRTDSSAKFQPAARTIAPAQNQDPYNDPFNQFNPATGGSSFWLCRQSGLTTDSSYYHCYFRPDRTQ